MHSVQYMSPYITYLPLTHCRLDGKQWTGTSLRAGRSKGRNRRNTWHASWLAMHWRQTLSVHCNLVAPMIPRAWQLPPLHISRFYSYSRMRESKVLPWIKRGSCRWPLTCYGSQTRHSIWALAAKCFTFRFQLFCCFGRLIMWSLFCTIFSYS